MTEYIHRLLHIAAEISKAQKQVWEFEKEEAYFRTKKNREEKIRVRTLKRSKMIRACNQMEELDRVLSNIVKKKNGRLK